MGESNTITVAGVEYPLLRLDDLEGGDLELIQQETGADIGALNLGDVRILNALVLVVMRRQDPEATIAMARKCKFREIQRVAEWLLTEDEADAIPLGEPAASGAPS